MTEGIIDNLEFDLSGKTLEIRGDRYNAGGRNVLFHVDCEEIK